MIPPLSQKLNAIMVDSSTVDTAAAVIAEVFPQNAATEAEWVRITTLRSKTDWPDFFQDMQDIRHFLISATSKVMGIFSLYKEASRLHLVGFGLLPAHQSQGIGAQALALARYTARSFDDAKVLTIGIARRNARHDRLLKFYQRCGASNVVRRTPRISYVELPLHEDGTECPSWSPRTATDTLSI